MGMMFSLPTISIITPSFNQGQFLEKCIGSILSQNYPRLEYIVMDGGSTDGSVDIIRRHEKHLTYWQSQPDGGHYNAVQEGLKRTTGDILCWLNSDDMFHPGGLFQVASVFQNHAEVEWITGKRVGFDERDFLISFGHELQTWPRENLLDPEFIDKHIFVMQEATFWKRSLWERAGGELDLVYDLAADFELWCRFSRYARLYTVDGLLAGYRYHSVGQRSQQFRNDYVAQCKLIIAREKEMVSTVAQYEPVPPPVLTVKPSSELLQVMVRNSPPVISIVTPSYNQGAYLEECIDSILSQNYPNLEYIIMDGGSTDSSVGIIKRHEKYLKYWQSCPDGGQYRAVSDGFRKTSGEIMAWLNSDDKYHRDAFYKVAYLFESHGNVEWLTGRPSYWDKSGALARFEESVPKFSRGEFLQGHYDQPFIQQESTFWRRSLWERAGGTMRHDLDLAGDLELWMRFFRYALLYSANTFIAGYRSHGDQKAVLYVDRYIEEANCLIAAEADLFGDIQPPQEPAPLVFDLAGYREYLELRTQDGCSVTRKMSAEATLAHLLSTSDTLRDTVETLRQEARHQQQMRLQFELAAQNVTTRMQYLELNLQQLEASLSWRITKPLRWLGDMIQKKG